MQLAIWRSPGKLISNSKNVHLTLFYTPCELEVPIHTNRHTTFHPWSQIFKEQAICDNSWFIKYNESLSMTVTKNLTDVKILRESYSIGLKGQDLKGLKDGVLWCWGQTQKVWINRKKPKKPGCHWYRIYSNEKIIAQGMHIDFV